MQLYINSFLEFNLFVITSMTFSYALVYDIIFENPQAIFTGFSFTFHQSHWNLLCQLCSFNFAQCVLDRLKLSNGFRGQRDVRQTLFSKNFKCIYNTGSLSNEYCYWGFKWDANLMQYNPLTKDNSLIKK